MGGLARVMPMTARIQRLVQEKASSQEIKREAVNDGMLTLREYAIKKLARGETTIDEVIAVTDETHLY